MLIVCKMEKDVILGTYVTVIDSRRVYAPTYSW